MYSQCYNLRGEIKYFNHNLPEELFNKYLIIVVSRESIQTTTGITHYGWNLREIKL
jgi:hypothetical protein